LPDIPQPARAAALARYLQNAAADFSAAEQADVGRQVLTILNDLVFAEVFAPGSRAEVPIVGRLERPLPLSPIPVAGQVDRLAVTGEYVLIADYKTDQVAPADLGQLPKPYVGQLALYGAVLARIFPNRTIRAALIFTEGPKLFELPAGTMAAALAEAI
jgi:ATP-dependent helicase/nuclease subunit A